MIVRAVLIFVEAQVSRKSLRRVFRLIFFRQRARGAPFFESCCRNLRQPPESAARPEMFAHALEDSRVELGRPAQKSLQSAETDSILKKLSTHARVQTVQCGHDCVQSFVDGRGRALRSR